MLNTQTLVYLLGLVLYVALRPLYTSLMRRILKLTKSEVDDKIFEALDKPLWLAVLFLLLDLLINSVFYNFLIHATLLTVIVLLVAVALVRAGKVFTFEFLSVTLNVKDKQMRDTVLTVLNNIYVATVLFFAFIYALGIWGVDITPFIASAGLFGLVIGLALKDPLENLISGILLITDPPFRVGDAVKVGDVVGTVKDIGLRNTRILTYEGDVVTMPNSMVLHSVIVDYHLPTDKVRAITRIGASYDVPPEKVEKVLLDIAKKHPKVLKDPEPMVLLLEFGDSAIIYELRFWTKLPHKLTTLSEINKEIWERFKEEGIEIPYPIRTIYIRNEE